VDKLASLPAAVSGPAEPVGVWDYRTSVSTCSGGLTIETDQAKQSRRAVVAVICRPNLFTAGFGNDRHGFSIPRGTKDRARRYLRQTLQNRSRHRQRAAACAVPDFTLAAEKFEWRRGGPGGASPRRRTIWRFAMMLIERRGAPGRGPAVVRAAGDRTRSNTKKMGWPIRGRGPPTSKKIFVGNPGPTGPAPITASVRGTLRGWRTTPGRSPEMMGARRGQFSPGPAAPAHRLVGVDPKEKNSRWCNRLGGRPGPDPLALSPERIHKNAMGYQGEISRV